MMLAQLSQDERDLLTIVRTIKQGTGFGEFTGTVTGREIVTVREMRVHKLKKQ